jgi:hypothetical protein
MYVFTYIYIYIYIYIHVHTYICLCVCMYICIHIHICMMLRRRCLMLEPLPRPLCICQCVCVCMCVCMSVYVRMCAFTYIFYGLFIQVYGALYHTYMYTDTHICMHACTTPLNIHDNSIHTHKHTYMHAIQTYSLLLFLVLRLSIHDHNDVAFRLLPTALPARSFFAWNLVVLFDDPLPTITPWKASLRNERACIHACMYACIHSCMQAGMVCACT